MIYLFNDVKELTGTVRNSHILNLLYEREKNGIYSVSAEIPVTYNDQGTIYNYNKKIQKSDFLGHYDKEGRFQLHKIAAVDIENGSIFVKGIHIFFDEAKAGAIIKDRRFVNREIIDGARVAFESIGWSVADFDVSVGKTYNFYNVTPLEARQILVETFGFEFDYWLDFDGKKVTNRHVAVKEKIGEKTSKRYTYGHNVLNIRAEQDYSEIYTAVIGRGKGEEIEETGGYGRRIEYTDVVWTTPSNPLNKPAGTRILEDPNATQLFGYKENGVIKPRIKVEVFSDIESPTDLIQASYDWLMDNNVPKAVFSLKVADGDGLNLGDEVYVIYRDIDLVKSARVEKVTDDLVSGNRDVEFGDTAYFDTDRRLSGLRADLKRYSGETGDRIYRLKMEFNRRFDEEVSSWVTEFEQNLIDQKALIEADRENMTNLIEGTRTEFTDNLNAEITQTKEYAEQQARAKADSVQTNLDSFKDSHQQLYDEVTGNILDIDTFLGDKSKTLKQQFDKVRTDFGTLQTDLNGVESDLTATKTDLQKQLDEARKAFDELEVGGRNYQRNITENYSKSPVYNDVEVKSENSLLITYAVEQTSTPYVFLRDIEPLNTNEEYTINFYATLLNPVEEYESLSLIHGIRGVYSDQNVILRSNERKRITLTFTPNSENGKMIIFPRNYNKTDKPVFLIEDVMLTKGNIATDWTPAPEDTEEKITTLNQQIEFIDGQLSAKLEQTDLLPINNKITEYGNSLTANAQSIQSLLDKTELHDGDITKWSNETKANAESISQTLTRVEETESGISHAQTDIQTNADGLSTLITRVGKTETGIDSLTTSLTAEAGKVETLISKTDGHTTQLANIVADYNSIEQTVAANDEWLGTHGSNVLQTVEGFNQKVWQADIHNPNMIPFNNLTLVENRKQWLARSFDGVTYLDEQKMIRISNYTSPHNYVQSPYVSLQAGETYTLSFTSLIGSSYNLNDLMQYTYVVYPEIDNVLLRDLMKRELIGSAYGVNIYKFTATFTAEETSDKARILIGAYVINQGERSDLFIGKPKLEFGERATLYNNALSIFEQRADELKLAVTDSDGLASVIALSPTAIDLISDKINVTGNVNIKGGVTALAVDAIEGNFARLFANHLTVDVITADHLAVGTAMIDKFFATSARIDRLITKTHFVNEMHALTLNVIDLNASNIRTRLLSANTIEAEWLKGGTALLDKVFASTAMFERMMTKSGFVTTLNTVTIDTDQITIRRPDGVPVINNGMASFDYTVQMTEYIRDADVVSWNGSFYQMNSNVRRHVMIGNFKHSARYLKVGLVLGMHGSSPSSSEYMYYRIESFGGPLSYTKQEKVMVFKNSNTDVTAVIDLGRPTFQRSSFYIYLVKANASDGGTNAGNIVQLRTNSAYLEG